MDEEGTIGCIWCIGCLWFFWIISGNIAMILVLLTIIPRVFFYNLIDIFINKIKEKYECQMGEEHEDFRQDLANKMERGDNTNWSKTSLPNDPKRYST